MDITKLKTVQLRSRLDALGFDSKGNKKALVTRLKNALPDSSTLNTSMKNKEEIAILQSSSQATKQSCSRQSLSLVPREDILDEVNDESDNISEEYEEITSVQENNSLDPNWDNKQNNWYNVFDKMDHSSIDIKEEFLSVEEFDEGAQEPTSRVYSECQDKDKTLMPNAHITAQERHKIVLLREEGLSVAAIARETGVARNTVYLWIKRWDSKGNVNEIKKPGRPKKISRNKDSDILQRLKENLFFQSKNCQDIDKTIMPFNAHVTAQERHKMVLFREAGLSIAAIARETGVADNIDNSKETNVTPESMKTKGSDETKKNKSSEEKEKGITGKLQLNNSIKSRSNKSKTIAESYVHLPKEYPKLKDSEKQVTNAKKIPKTNAQRQQRYRQNRKKLQQSESLNLKLARKKIDAERSKRYREKLKSKKQRAALDCLLSSNDN